MGIHIKATAYHNHNIHQGPIPENYKELPHVVQCINYPDSNQVSDFDPFNSNLDGTMSQVTDINTQYSEYENDNENDIFAYVADNVRTSIVNEQKTKSFYAQLKPNFTEAVNWITDQEEVDQFAKMLDSFVSDIKKKHQICNDETSSHTYVSSNLAIETSRKHHGCESWKRNKRHRK